MASRITNKARFRAILKSLPASVKKRIRAAIFEEAERIAEDMRDRAPFRTGALKRSIAVTPGDQPLPIYASLKSRIVRADPELSAVITAGKSGKRSEGGVRYAHLVEFGTAPFINGGEFKGTVNPGSPAQPFFFPALKADKRAAQKKINDAARQGIRDGLK